MKYNFFVFKYFFKIFDSPETWDHVLQKTFRVWRILRKLDAWKIYSKKIVNRFCRYEYPPKIRQRYTPPCTKKCDLTGLVVSWKNSSVYSDMRSLVLISPFGAQNDNVKHFAKQIYENKIFLNLQMFLLYFRNQI